jgi:hypothetical protein
MLAWLPPSLRSYGGTGAALRAKVRGFYSAWTRGSPSGVGRPRADMFDTFSVGIAGFAGWENCGFRIDRHAFSINVGREVK